MRLPAVCLALLFFAGCAPQQPSTTDTRLTPERVLAWADLEAHLGRHPQQLQVGQADGRDGQVLLITLLSDGGLQGVG